MPEPKPANVRRFGTIKFAVFAAAFLVLVLQASASRALKIDEAKIGIPGLHDIPLQVGPWETSVEGAMTPDVAAYLRPDEYILRDYKDGQDGQTINLFVAYFKSLQNTYGPHSPRICLPGSGWLVSSSKVMNIPIPGRSEPIPANQFTMEQGNQHILVLYWYQNDRDVWAEEFHAKLRLLPDLIRYRRSDVSLVRLVTSVNGVTPDRELSECTRFTERVFPLLAQHFESVH
jgi:EpsI family protein